MTTVLRSLQTALNKDTVSSAAYMNLTSLAATAAAAAIVFATMSRCYHKFSKDESPLAACALGSILTVALLDLAKMAATAEKALPRLVKMDAQHATDCLLYGTQLVCYARSTLIWALTRKN